jgi:hypothetical protein
MAFGAGAITQGGARRGLSALAVALVTAASALCDAQTAPSNAGTAQGAPAPQPPDAREQEARAAFEAGVAALTDERYSDALTHFDRSYQIRRAASVALNLGVTLRALGRLVEARVRFNEFLELANAAQHERHDREVATFIADIARRVGRVRIAVVEPSAARVLIDGRRASLDENDEVVVDPGEHRVEAVLSGYESAQQTVRVESAGRAEVQLRLRRPVSDPRVTLGPGPAPATQGGGILQSPAFWVTVGLVVTAAVAIPVTIVATSGPDIPRLPGVFCIRTDGQGCAVESSR